jgi:V8-like Glu-specific endopeptidase
MLQLIKMNEKNTLYLLIALVVMMVMTDPSYAIPMRREPMSVSPALPVSANAVKSSPVGFLFMKDPNTGKQLGCTASVINTPQNGNVIATAAHCLFNGNGQQFTDIEFSPGFNHGQDGPLGRIPAAVVKVTDAFLANNDVDDYGLVRLNFQGPNGEPLQDITGSLGYRFDIGNDVPTVIFGYPFGGDFEDCPNDGQTLCFWEGETELEQQFRVITDENLGTGASGGPWIWNYDPETNVGWLYSNSQAYDVNNDETVGPIYSEEDFNVLLAYVTTH